jgi:hypothetical protein
LGHTWAGRNDQEVLDMPEQVPSDSPIDDRPPADEEPAALEGEDAIPGANEPADGVHACQPPREHPPAAGARWECPECGRVWLLQDISESREGGPGQTVAWKEAD